MEVSLVSIAKSRQGWGGGRKERKRERERAEPVALHRNGIC